MNARPTTTLLTLTQAKRRCPYPRVTKRWKQSDGAMIRLCDMQDTHLINTLRFVERKSEFPHPSIYDALLAEARRRQWLRVHTGTTGPAFNSPTIRDLRYEMTHEPYQSRLVEQLDGLPAPTPEPRRTIHSRSLPRAFCPQPWWDGYEPEGLSLDPGPGQTYPFATD